MASFYVPSTGSSGVIVETGSGSAYYKSLDSLGRPTGADASITPDMIKTGTPANPSITPPGWAGNGTLYNQARGHLLGAQAARGVAGDQGGHLIAHRFVLDQGGSNLFPQEANFNMSAFKTLENDYARAIDQGNRVDFSHVLGDFDSTGRPGSVSVNYRIVDQNGNVIDT